MAAGRAESFEKIDYDNKHETDYNDLKIPRRLSRGGTSALACHAAGLGGGSPTILNCLNAVRHT